MDDDEAIECFADVLGFDPVDASPSLVNDGRPKRQLVVRPVGAEIGILLALADGPDRHGRVGDPSGGQVGRYARVDDVDAASRRLEPRRRRAMRDEPYGSHVVFEDLCGNRWDLPGPLPA